jgi:hypothetical protein
MSLSMAAPTCSPTNASNWNFRLIISGTDGLKKKSIQSAGSWVWSAKEQLVTDLWRKQRCNGWVWPIAGWLNLRYRGAAGYSEIKNRN